MTSADDARMAHILTEEWARAAAGAGLDDESVAWLRALRANGALRDEAVRRLHDLMFAASYREVARRRTSLSGDDLADLATQCADDATVAVLNRLSSYRGASRFTTWAYKFAVLTSAVAVRRLAWRDREIPTDPLAWTVPAELSLDLPEPQAEAATVARAVRMAIDDVLTPHQRRVLLAVTIHGVPIDVLADELTTTRGALYKTLHTARARLRRELQQQGLSAATRGAS